jgi:hypothetical protein
MKTRADRVGFSVKSRDRAAASCQTVGSCQPDGGTLRPAWEVNFELNRACVQRHARVVDASLRAVERCPRCRKPG